MKRFWIIGLVVIALAIVTGCSKFQNPVAPDVDEPDEVSSLLAVYAVDIDGASVSGVAVYTKEGVPATLRPWPAGGRNTTPVEFNAVEPGSYTLVGVKAGFDTTITSVIIAEGASVTKEMVMRQKSVTPEPEPQEERNFEMEYDPSSQIFRFTGTIFEECINDTIIFDGSIGRMTKLSVASLPRQGKWYEVNMSQLTYRYTRVTYKLDDTWYFHSYYLIGVPLSNFRLVGVMTELPYNDQWFTLIGVPEWNIPQPATKGTFKLTTVTSDVTVKLNNVLWDQDGEWQLDPGQYTLEVSKSGYNTYLETFQLEAGQVVPRTITLTAIVTPPPPVTIKTILTRTSGSNVITISGTRPLPAGVKFGFYGNNNIVERVSPSGNTVTIPATSTGNPFTNYWLEGDEANFLPSNYDLLGGGHEWDTHNGSHHDARLK